MRPRKNYLFTALLLLQSACPSNRTNPREIVLPLFQLLWQKKGDNRHSAVISFEKNRGRKENYPYANNKKFKLYSSYIICKLLQHDMYIVYI